jgi:hypothetical protein
MASPACVAHHPLAIFPVGDDRRGVVGENARHRRLVVVAVGHGAGDRGNLSAGFHQGVKVAHRTLT